MRRICISTGNQGNHAGITDLVMLLRNGARDCGHDAMVTVLPEPGEWNIMIESFEDPRSRALLRQAYTPGTRYIVVCTEELTGQTFNEGLVSGHLRYSNAANWKARFDGLLAIIDLVDDLWVGMSLQPYPSSTADSTIDQKWSVE